MTVVGSLSGKAKLIIYVLMLDLKPATFEEFEHEASRGNVVPVTRTVLADLQTPLGAFLRTAGGASYSVLLE